MNEHPAEAGDVDPVPPVRACDIVDEGGDPPCWAHLFEDPERESVPARVSNNDAGRPSGTPADDVRQERRP